MNARQPADGPPNRDNARGQAGVDTAGDNNSKDTASPGPAQPPRFEVRTRKSSGVEFVFQTYDTRELADGVAQRLRDIGGNATVVEVEVGS